MKFKNAFLKAKTILINMKMKQDIVFDQMKHFNVYLIDCNFYFRKYFKKMLRKRIKKKTYLQALKKKKKVKIKMKDESQDIDIFLRVAIFLQTL